MDREERINKISRAYYKLLTSLDWTDELLVKGIREGLGKFLSNAFISTLDGNKYDQGDYYSTEAAHQRAKGTDKELVYEHIVPKGMYIQKPCIKRAVNNSLTFEYTRKIIDKFYFIAIITKDEDTRLLKNSMPENWDEKDIFARYKEANVELIDRETALSFRKTDNPHN